MNTFASDSCDVSLKHSALEHVGTVAASLRRDAVMGREQDKTVLAKALDKVGSLCLDLRVTDVAVSTS